MHLPGTGRIGPNRLTELVAMELDVTGALGDSCEEIEGAGSSCGGRIRRPGEQRARALS
jgi:hypothetical protein